MINILSPDYADVIPISFPVILYIPTSCKVPGIVFILFYYMTEKNWTKVEDLFSYVHTTLLQEYNIWIYGGLGCTTDHHLLRLEIVSPIQRGFKTCLQPGLPVHVS